MVQVIDGLEMVLVLADERLSILRVKHEDLILYNAGSPGFMRNFTRDSLISGILMEDAAMLQDQLEFCARLQGKKIDPVTGEEYGRIHHEVEYATGKGVILDRRFGLSTAYAACDTNALFLIAEKIYQDITKDTSIAERHLRNIIAAADNIVLHVNQKGLFEEDPKYAGARNYALKATYWKDSAVLNRENGEPAYPVTYTLAHIQAMAGLRSAHSLTADKKYLEIEKKMLDSLHLNLYDNDKEEFLIALDAEGPIRGISSDMLHSLFYLKPHYLSDRQLRAILEKSSVLETPVGYMALNKECAEQVDDSYHRDFAWVFEHAPIDSGSRKFGVLEPTKVAQRIIPFAKLGCEIVGLDGTPAGCSPQLWSIAADKYFENPRIIDF